MANAACRQLAKRKQRRGAIVAYGSAREVVGFPARRRQHGTAGNAPTTSEKLDRIYKEFAAAIADTARIMSVRVGAKLNAKGEKDQVDRDYVVECRDRFCRCELRIKPLGYMPLQFSFSEVSCMVIA
ncbi:MULTISPECIES: hypothetical protein [unclassified Caballeronia]|uniref:hypothetical protein n=1 Tax=unclassified Caballeronia TaxID=2646786 RepID=UPI00202811CB|nr:MULTISPECIES: hypothetical protein [unclassified Caballeronia]